MLTEPAKPLLRADGDTITLPIDEPTPRSVRHLFGRAAAGHRERPLGADVVVETRIVKSKGDVTRLDYLLRQDQGGRRISDVYLDGSISQLAVHRSEFHSILRREGVDGLVMALNRKVDLLRNVAKAS